MFKSSRGVVSVRASRLFEAPSVHGWAAFRVSVHPLTDTWAASLVMVNHAAVNIQVQVSVWARACLSLGGFLEWNC